MAESLNDLQQHLLDAKDAVAELSALDVLTTNEKTAITGVDSDSKVSIWRLFIWIVAFGWYLQQRLWDIFQAEIDATVKANRPHTSEWYKAKALAFQYGDVLVDSDEYAVIDETKQIIKQAAIVEGDRELIIKIATLVGGLLSKITDINKVNAFIAYMNKIKDAGTLLTIVNEDPDKLKVELDYYYDALLVKSDGTTIDTGENVVEKAINAYLKSVDFDGIFDLLIFQDYLQKATGHKSLKLLFIGFKAGTATTYTAIDRVYETLSGSMTLEEITVNYYAAV